MAVQENYENHAREKGQPVYFRAELDVDNSALSHTFLDDNGCPVPPELVSSEGGPGVLTATQLAEAYAVMDDAVEHLVNLWNEDLCIYLWQVILHNSS